MERYEWSASKVRELREHLRLSQAQLGRKMGVRQATVSEWETGQYRPRGASARLLSLIAESAGFLYDPSSSESRVPRSEGSEENE